MLSKDNETEKFGRCCLLVSFLLPDTTGRLNVFSVESSFIFNAKINYRNNCWLVHDSEDVPVVCKGKSSAEVHVPSTRHLIKEMLHQHTSFRKPDASLKKSICMFYKVLCNHR